MVSIDWSSGRKSPFDTTLTILPKLYVSARTLHNEKRKVFVLEQNRRFAVASSNDSSLEQNQIKLAASDLFNEEFESFVSYENARFKVI